MGKVAQRAGKPALAGGAAAASIASTVAVGIALRPKRRKVPGVPVAWPKVRARSPKLDFDLKSLARNVPSASKLDIDSMASRVQKTGKQVGRMGEQLSRIATDIQKAGQTAERVGKLLSK